MSARPESSIWPDLELDPVQNHNAHEGTRRTLPGWLTTMAKRMGRRKEKRNDDAGFRRGRASMYPVVPGEENRNPNLARLSQPRLGRVHSRDLSDHSATDKGNMYRQRLNVSETTIPVVSPAPSRPSLRHLPPISTTRREFGLLRHPDSSDDDLIDLQNGVEEPSRSQSGNSGKISSRRPDGTYKTSTVTI